ncbi:MAG: sensor histidine kinase [Flavisolibacter sp.]
MQGTGLGLNIVKRYVELLDGEISFVSKENDGTTFTVEFPQNKQD